MVNFSASSSLALVTRFAPFPSPPRDARARVVARAREKDDLSANRIGAIVLVIVDAFVVAALTGLVEPVAAVLSAALLNQVLSPQLIEGALVVVAGVMLSVSCRELLPQAIRKHGKAAAAGGLAGWLTMRLGLSLVKDHHSE